MSAKLGKKEIATTIIYFAGMLSVPVLVVKNRMKKIRLEEKEKRNIYKILKYTIELENNLTNTMVMKYMKFIKSIDIPDKALCKNIIIDGYNIVKNSNKISDRLKSELRILLDCMGINFSY